MVALQERSRGSIRFWLLVLLMPGMIALSLVDSWNDYRAMSRETEQVYDSALLEPAKVLETSVEFNADGSLRIDPPFYAQVMLESRSGNRKYFRVEEVTPLALNLAGSATQQLEGRTLLGMQGLPRPPHLADNEGVPMFYDAMYRNDTVRMVALWRDLHYKGVHRQIIVLVGESRDMRLLTQQTAWRQALFRDGRMLLLGVLLIWLSVQGALRPLNQLRREIQARRINNLSPLDTGRVPREVVPLVKAVNHHIDLYRQVLERQANFLADASHQLRTPLAIMRTQAQYAKREPDIGRMRETLDAIINQLGQTSRLTEQLLSLAHASHSNSTPHGEVDLNRVAREVVLQYLPLARERAQDLGWIESAQDPRSQSGVDVVVLGNESEIHESLANLIHNAINHAGDGCTITVSTGTEGRAAWVSVCDNGVGLESSLRESVFVRFDRGRSSRKGARGSGSGLGLAIALAYAQRNGGTIELKDGDEGAPGQIGLCAVLKMPRLIVTPDTM